MNTQTKLFLCININKIEAYKKHDETMLACPPTVKPQKAWALSLMHRKVKALSVPWWRSKVRL
jgi:hypothetical protein